MWLNSVPIQKKQSHFQRFFKIFAFNSKMVIATKPGLFSHTFYLKLNEVIEILQNISFFSTFLIFHESANISSERTLLFKQISQRYSTAFLHKSQKKSTRI